MHSPFQFLEIVTLQLPETSQWRRTVNRHIIDQNALNMLKSTIFFLNCVWFPHLGTAYLLPCFKPKLLKHELISFISYVDLILYCDWFKWHHVTKYIPTVDNLMILRDVIPRYIFCPGNTIWRHYTGLYIPTVDNLMILRDVTSVYFLLWQIPSDVTIQSLCSLRWKVVAISWA